MFSTCLNFYYKEEKAMALRRAALLLVLLTALLGAARKMQDDSLTSGPATAARLLFDCIDLLGGLWTWAHCEDNCDPPQLWSAAAQQMLATGGLAAGLLAPTLTSKKYFGINEPSTVR